MSEYLDWGTPKERPPDTGISPETQVVEPDVFIWRGDPASSPPLSRAKSARKVGLAVAVLLVVAGIGGYLAVKHSKTTPGNVTTPSASSDLSLTAAVQSTVAARSASITFSGSATAGSVSAEISGSGEASFGPHSQGLSAVIAVTSPSVSVTVNEIAADNRFYYGVTEDGKNVIGEIAPGAEWAEAPLPAASSLSSSSDTGIYNPLDQLKLLESKGYSVTSIGSRTRDGQTVVGYRVKISQAEMTKALKEALKGTPKPFRASMRTAEKQISESFQVWVYASSHLLQQIVVQTDGTTTSTVHMTFGDYGKPVQIVAPGPSTVVSYSTYLSDVERYYQSLGGASTERS